MSLPSVGRVLSALALVSATLTAVMVGGASAAPGDVTIYLSSTNEGTAGGVAFDDEDIMAYDVATQTYSLYFDGSDVMPVSADIDGFRLNGDGTISLSLVAPATLADVGSVDDSDIVVFTPTALGETTAGTFALELNGNAVGLVTADEDVIAIAADQSGQTLVSTLGSYNVPGAGGNFGGPDDDLIAFDGTNWALHFDGSDVALASSEDVMAASVDQLTGDIHLAARGSYNVPGLAGDFNDIFTFSGTTGSNTSGTYSLLFDGGTAGYDEQIDGIHVDVELGANADPVAVDDAASVGEDGPGVVVDVLGNDSDSDAGDTLSVIAVDDAGTTGSVTLNAGVVTYDPNGQFESLNAGESDTDTFGYTISDGRGGTATATVTMTIDGADEAAPGDKIYVSLRTSGDIGSIVFTDEDILEFDTGSGTWSLYFDGSDVLPGSADLDGLRLNDDGSISMSFENGANISGLGTVDDSDIVVFTPTSLGANTAGSFALELDGSTAGLTTSNEDVIGIAESVAGNTLITTLGGLNVPAVGGGTLAGADEDVIALDGSSWSMLFDGSDVTLGSEDLMGISTNAITGDLAMAIRGAFSVDGITGNGNDIIVFSGTTGPNTAGSFTLIFDGDVNSLAGFDIDAVHVEPVAAPPVGDPPTANDDTAAVGEDGPAIDIDVLDNDTDPDAGDVLSVVSIDSSGTTGAVSLVGGVVSYDPNGQFESLGDGESAGDSFGYTITDGNGGFDSANVQITVNGADELNPPTATDDGPAAGSSPGDPFHVALDTALNGGPGTLTGNDDLGSPAATVTSFGAGDLGGAVTDNAAGSTVALGAGSLSIGADGSVAFTPDTGFTGLFSVSYRIENSAGSSDATLSVFVGDRPAELGDRIYLSSTTSGSVGGVNFTDEDVVEYNSATGVWSMYFDGSDVVPGSADLDAFTINDDGTLSLSFDNPANIAGLGSVDDSNVVIFTPTSLGANTAGSFSLEFTGSSVGLTSSNEDLLALTRTDTGQALISTLGGYSVPAAGGGTLSGADEDIIALDGTTWSLFFDGSDLGLGPEDVMGASLDSTTGDLALALRGAYTAGGLTGDANDVIVFTGTTGPATSGTFSLLFDGNLTGFGGEQIDALHVVPGADPPTNDDPVAVADAVTFGEDGPGAAVAVLDNDSDPNAGDTLTVDSVDDAGTTGSVTLVGGVVSYDPNGQFESLAVGESDTDTFSYVVSDGNGGTDTATVTVTVDGANDGPVAAADAASVDEDGPGVTVGVLDNDSDVDASDTLVVDSVDDTGTTGLVTLVGGVVSYDPNGQFESLNAGESDTDTFSYVVSDGNGGTDAATVTMTINGADDNGDPVAVADAVTFGEDGPGAAVAVLDNDSDPNAGDTLTVDSVDDTGTTGLVTLVGGVVSYDPNGQFESLAVGESDTDTFSYTVSDGNGGTDTAIVTVTVDGANDGPVAADDAASVDEDGPGVTVGVLDNDSDVDASDTLVVDSVDDTGTVGLVTLNAGVVSYDPNGQFESLIAGESDTDTFSYVVSDGNGGTDTATVTMTINGADDNGDPVAVADAVTFGEDGPGAAVAVLDNDSDPNAGDTLTVDSVDDTGTTGSVTLVGGVVSYDPNGQFESLAVGESDTDTFSYTVSDGNGGTDTATVTVTVDGANDGPVAADDAASVDEDGPGVTVGVLDNDSDVDASDTLVVDSVDDTGTVGLVTLNAGVVSYDPNGQFESLIAGESDTDTFSYVVSDGNGGTDTATVTMTINGADDNGDPVAVADAVTFGEDGPGAAVAVLDNDSDPNTGDTLTVDSVDDTGTTGSVTLVGGVVSYDPNGQFESLAVGESDTDTFSYTVSDGNGGTDTATVTVTVDGANDDPVATDDTASVEEDGPGVTVGVLDNDSDVDASDTLVVDSVDDTGTTGLVTLVGGVVSYDPNGQFESLNAGESDTDTFSYTVSDGNGGTDTATVTMTINGADEIEPDSIVYISSNFAGSIGGVTYNDEDVLQYNITTGVWSLHFDGSDVLADSGSLDMDALYVNDDGTIDMSFQFATNITGIGSVDDSDIVRFTPTSLGANTAGSFSLIFDASNFGLTSGSEDTKAIARDASGNLVISTIGTSSVSATGGGTLSAPDEDLFILDGSTTWSTFIDGSDVSLTNTSEDIRGASIGASGTVYLSTLGAHSVPNVSGGSNDILAFTGSTGPSTSGTFSVFFDGDSVGFTDTIAGFHVVGG